MPIRWIKNHQDDDSSRKGCLFTLVLEEEDLPFPMTNHLTTWHLASIEERFLVVNIPTVRAYYKGLFWVSVDRNLDRLNIDHAKREKIERQISQKVPRPPDDWALWGVVCVPSYD